MKPAKELKPAAALVAHFLDHRPDEPPDAWRDLLSRGRRSVARAEEGAGALPRLVDQDLARPLLDALNASSPRSRHAKRT